METFQTSFPLADESSQMWSLNKRLEAYLARVKALEEENELLRAEIHHLRKEPKAPSVRTYHEEIMKLRDALDDGHQKMVEAEMARDSMYQEIELIKDLCLQEKKAQEEVKREMCESKKLLEDERRAQNWLKERLVQLEEEMEDILRVHEEDKAAMEEEISSFSQRLDSFKVAPVAFQPINLEDYSMKLSQVWQGAVEDYKNEVSSLESSLSEARDNLRKVLDENKQSQLQLQNLDRELQSLKSRKEMLEEVLEKQWLEQHEEEGRLQLEIETLEKEKQDLRAQIAQVLEDRQQLMHLKMSLSLEVATYRSLLEAESTRIYSPTADYKLSSPFGDSVLEKTPLRKRSNESTKTPVARDYRTIPTKRQSAEKSELLSHTPSRQLNVKSTLFSGRPSPVTKEFQKVSSVLQSQSLKYTKVPTEKATTTVSSLERRTERRPPTEDVFKKSKVEAVSYSYSQGSTKELEKSVTLPVKEQPLHTTEQTKTEPLENGFLLPGEQEILEVQQKIDHLESTLNTVKDPYAIVHNAELEDQPSSLRVDLQDLQSNNKAQEDVQQRDLPGQEIDLVLESEEVVSEVVSCQGVLFEKHEVMQSLEYQNIETMIKEDVTDQRTLQAISEPHTEDSTAELLARTPTHEQEVNVTLVQAEREEPNALSSDVVSEYKSSTPQEQDYDGRVSFDLDLAISPSSDMKEDTKEWDTFLANQNVENADTEQVDSSLEKVEHESKLQEEQVIDEQAVSTPKQDETQEQVEPVGQSDIKDEFIFESPEFPEKFSDDTLNVPQVYEQEADHINAEQHGDEIVASEEVRSLSREIDNTHQKESEEESTPENLGLKLAPPEGLEESTEQEESQLSDIGREPDYFEGEVKKSDVEESSQEHDTEQVTKEEFVSLHDDIQVSESSQELNQEDQKSLELRSSESDVYVERRTQIICVTEQVFVDNKEFSDQSENEYSSETGLQEIQQELEGVERSGKENEVHELLSAGVEVHIEADEVQTTKLESEDTESLLSDVAQDSVHILENIEDSQVEEKKLSELRDVELDQSNTEDNAQLVDDIDDGDQSVDKSQEQISDIKQDSSFVPEAEPLDSLQTLDIGSAQTEQQDNKMSLDEDSSPLEAKETILSTNDVIEEPQPDQPSSMSCAVAENEVNAVVEEQPLSQFCELKEDFVETFAENVNLVPEELKDFEPQGAKETKEPTDTDFTTSLQEELFAEEEAEPRVTHDIPDAPTTTNTVQENQPEEHEPKETKEEDIKLEESQQTYQELVESLACALLKEVALEKPISADRVQEPETSYELSSDVERKVTFQEESEEITELTEEVITQESREVLSVTYSEQHDVDTQLVHQPCDATHGEELELTEPEKQIPEKEAEECILESEIIESVDFIPVSQESKGIDADQEPELDHEPICGTQPEKETEEEQSCNVIQEEASYDHFENVFKKVDTTEDEEECKDFRDPQADQVSEPDQEHVSDAEAKIITQQESTEGDFSHDVEETNSPHEIAQDSLAENEERTPEAHQVPDIVQEDISEQKSEFESETRTEEVHEETSEIVSTTVEKVFSEQNEEAEHLEAEVDELTVESTEQTSHKTELKAEAQISESENTESDIELRQESQDPEPELIQETLPYIQQEVAHQQEDEEHFSKDPEEQTTPDNVEIVTKVTEDEEQEDLVKEPILETEPQVTLEEKNEDACINEAAETEISHGTDEVKIAEQDTTVEDWDDVPRDAKTEQGHEALLDMETNLKNQEVCFSEAAEEGIGQEPDEPVSQRAEQDSNVEDQYDVKVFTEIEAEQSHELVQEALFDMQSQLTLEKKEEECFSEAAEEEVHQETVEPTLKTPGQDTTVDVTDSGDAGAQQSQEPVQEPLFDLEAQLTHEEIKEEVSISEAADDEVCQEDIEPISKTTEQDTTVDVKESRHAELEQAQELAQESLLYVEPQLALEEKKVEVCFSKAAEEEISQQAVESILESAKEDTIVEVTDSGAAEAQESQEPVQESQVDMVAQLTLAEKKEEVSFSEVAEEEVSEEAVEPISETAEQDTTVDVKESRHAEPEQDQELVQECLLDVEPQLALEEKKVEVCFSEAAEEEISQQAVESNLETAQKDTIVDVTDSRDAEAQQSQEPVQEPQADMVAQLTLEEKREEVSISKVAEEEISQVDVEPISKTADQDATAENLEDSKKSNDAEAEQGQEHTEQEISQETDELFSNIENIDANKFTEEAGGEKTAEQEKVKQADNIESETVEEDNATPLNLEPEVGKDDITKETTPLDDSEPVTKEIQDPEVDGKPGQEEAKLLCQFEGEHETQDQSSDVKDVYQDINTDVCRTEDFSTSEEKQMKQSEQSEAESEQDGLALESAENETLESSESQVEESVGAGDGTQNIAQFNDPEATNQESFESMSFPVLNTEVEPDRAVKTEIDSYQSTEPKDTAEQETEHEEKGASEEKDEATSIAKYSTQPDKVDEIVSDQKEPEDDQKIPFSLSIIQNNLPFTSEDDAEVQPEKQECELSTDSTDLALDEKRSESANLQNDDIDLRKEEVIIEDKDLTENQQDEAIQEKQEETESEPVYEDSTVAPKPNDQIQDHATFLETENNEQGEEQTTVTESKQDEAIQEKEEETESEPVYKDSTVAPEPIDQIQDQPSFFESQTNEQGEEQTTVSETESESVYQDSTVVLEPSAQVQDQPSFFGIEHNEQGEEQTTVSETESEAVYQDSIVAAEPNGKIQDQATFFETEINDQGQEQTTDSEKESELVYQDSIVASEPNDQIQDQATFFETATNEQREEQTIASKTESEPVLVEQSLEQKLDSETLTVDPDFVEPTEGLIKTEEVQTYSYLEDDNSKSDESLDSQDISIYSQRSEDFEISKDYQLEQTLPDSTPLPNLDEEFEDLAEDKVIITSEDAQTVLATEEVVIISDLPEVQSDESKEGLKTTKDEPLFELKDGEESNSEAQETKKLEHSQDDRELIERTAETSIVLESDPSISSDDISPNITVIGHEVDPENKKGASEETSQVKEISDECEKVGLEEVEVIQEDETLLTSKSGQEASQHVELHTSDEEKDTTGDSSDSSFNSNSGNEREAAEEKHSSSTESNIYVKAVNGLHENTIVQATLDLEDLLVNGHSTGEQSKIVISERKTIVKVEEEIINTHTQDIIEESVLKFATSEGKGEGLFQSLLEKSELKEDIRLDETSTVEYVDSATDESHYTKKTIKPYLSDSEFTTQTDIKPSLVDESLVVDKDTNQQTLQTHQEKEDAWSSDE